MQLSNKIDTKYYYRFVEEVLKLRKINLPHERFKLIVLDEYKIETKEEGSVKSFADAYLYLLNNLNQVLTIDIIITTYYLLTKTKLNKKIAEKIITLFYLHYDETEHYLSALIHFTVLENVCKKRIEFAFMLSNYIMIKRNETVLIPFKIIHRNYYESIKEKNINKLMYLFAQMERRIKFNIISNNISKYKIIDFIKEKQNEIRLRFGVLKLFLYGSFSKEKRVNISDLDLLIIYEENLLNFERKKNNEELKKYLKDKLSINIDLIDFTHAMKNLDKKEMENIITLI